MTRTGVEVDLGLHELGRDGLVMLAPTEFVFYGLTVLDTQNHEFRRRFHERWPVAVAYWDTARELTSKWKEKPR